MVKLRSFLIAGSAILVVALAFFYLFPNEEKQVRKQFESLSRYVTKESGEDLLSMANRTQNIGKLFAHECQFNIEGDSFYAFSGKYSREEVTGYALRGRSYFSNLSLKFHDLKIEFPQKEVAKVRLTAVLSGKSTGGERVDEAREFLCVLQKIENKWLFSQFEGIEVLRK